LVAYSQRRTPFGGRRPYYYHPGKKIASWHPPLEALSVRDRLIREARAATGWTVVTDHFTRWYGRSTPYGITHYSFTLPPDLAEAYRSRGLSDMVS
jgi:hypothetical protein